MLTRSRHIVTTTATLILLAALLTGCSTVAAGSMPFADPAVPAATATASATPAPTAIPGDRDDDGELSEFEKQVLAKDAPRDYTMPDGSVVKIDPTQPLPDAVKAVVTAESVQMTSTSGTDNGEQKLNALADLIKFADAKEVETGKPIIIIYETLNVVSLNQGSPVTELVWASTASGTHSTGLEVTKSKEEMLAAAQAWAGPRGYEVIVSE